MKLYHAAQSRSTRVLWLLEELGLEYEIEQMLFDPKSMQSADFLAINPFGQVPVLIDDTMTMSESVAIMQYLLNRYGGGRLGPGHDTPAYGEFLQWMHFGESTMMEPIVKIIMHAIFLSEDQRIPAVCEEGRETYSRYLGIISKELANKNYLCGSEFSAADIVVGYNLFIMRFFELAPQGFPMLDGYYARLSSRSAFQNAIAD